MTILNQKNWDEVTDVATLKGVNTKRLGKRHVPINHGEALDLFKGKLADRNIKINTQNGMLSPDNYKYVYVVGVSTEGLTDGSYGFNLGFVNYNNKQKSLTVIAGEQVMVCSNECFTGQVVSSRRRHTENAMNDINERFDNGFEYFDKFVEQRSGIISTMRKREFGDAQLGEVVLSYHRESMIGNTHINRIIQEYDKPTFDYGTGGGTAWDFLNAVTHVLKGVNDPLARMNLQKDTDTYINEACRIEVPVIDV